MYYTNIYNSPLGCLTLACDDLGLVGLWIEGQKYFALLLSQTEHQEQPHPILDQTKIWLDLYFQGQQPSFTPPLHAKGTLFQKAVWDILSTIPYGKVMTYGDIAKAIAQQRGLGNMSAQAVGGAVGHNPISIIVPCHRVVGSNGSLTGYAGGIDKKLFLLKTEGLDITKFTIPTKSTAL